MQNRPNCGGRSTKDLQSGAALLDRLGIMPWTRGRLRRGWCARLGLSLVILLATLGTAALATRPEYDTFRREQRIDHTPASDEVLRIWMVYVEQGDGLIIHTTLTRMMTTTRGRNASTS